ncbi:FAD-dependent oxidoreductase [Sulfurovum sp. zt1-1]|uniref:FAD-dependent oxidoreductase n=1 Tax=Sulfurovum zhangzhouensis TaxID=3019067 RepID=A0ABT7R0I5_9BACT|nr:FAD-dependent oxidoreductase [Sulfurovum zhangzhouensis]MDM5272592.1 FAD-dependent oxidoreductase [Sulfurovum zhangzhouensis]
MKQRIIIIGAGISGLYAAMQLEQQFEVTILEARERVGGRALSINGHDLGPSWIWSHHKHALELVSSLGLEMFLQYTEGLALYQTTDVQCFNPPPQEPAARIVGGIGAFTEAIVNSLSKTQIRLNEAVTSIVKKSEGLQVYTKNTNYEADFVINTMPPRIAANIEYSPPLPFSQVELLRSIPTWMGYVVKVVVTYETAFWRDEGLSGFAFCHSRPLSEVHDAVTKDEAALFGFAGSRYADNDFKEKVIEQLTKLFGHKAKEYKNIYVVDWNREAFTAVIEDMAPLASHPQYGYDINAMDGKLLFAGTESSFGEGGYIEGAIRSALRNIDKVIKISEK